MLPRLQRYVSSELSHFVGAGLPSEEKRYQLLLKIIGDGALIPRDLLPNPGTTVYVHNSIEISLAEPLSGNKKYLPSAICFCDIPVEDLHLHVAKYSPFGVAFSKAFLVSKGAGPVWYVVRQAPAAGSSPSEQPQLNRAEIFDLGERVIRNVMQELGFMPPRISESAREEIRSLFEPEELKRVQLFAEHEIFSFIKFFDADMSDEDAKNFYMEREWRVVGRVPFELNNIERVFLRRAYAARFRADVPEYVGQLTFVD